MPILVWSPFLIILSKKCHNGVDFYFSKVCTLIFISTCPNKHIKAFLSKNEHIAISIAFDEKSNHIKGFDCRPWKIKLMNKQIKDFNMSTIKHMSKNQGFSEIKFNDDAYLTACLYYPYILRTWIKYPLTIF